MLSEILKIKPRIERTDLNRMVNVLSTRFTRVAKKFGSGLKGAMKGLASGGLLGVGIAFADKLLNPLKEAEERIKGLLAQADNLQTMGSQFETTAGKLFKLQQVGVSVGLTAEEMNQMLSRFQIALAQAREERILPEADRVSPVRNFTEIPDTAQAFFDFIRALKEAPKDQQILIQKQVFGDGLLRKQAELIQTDLLDRIKEIGLRSSEIYDQAIAPVARLSDQADIDTARRNSDELLSSSPLINENQVREMDRAERQRIEQQDKQLRDFEVLKDAAIAVSDIKFQAQEMFKLMYGFVPTAVDGINRITSGLQLIEHIGTDWLLELKKLGDSPIFRLKSWWTK